MAVARNVFLLCTQGEKWRAYNATKCDNMFRFVFIELLHGDKPGTRRQSVKFHHHHHHQVRVAGEGRRVVAPPCLRSTARLQSSPVGRVESFRSWSSQLFRGRPGGRRHV